MFEVHAYLQLELSGCPCLVRTDAERSARYVARYIARHLRARFPEDKRVRLVSFAENAREGLGRHRLHVETGGLAERRLGGLIHDLGLSVIGELRAQLSRSWRRKLARLLDPDEVTERDFWQIVGEARCCLEGAWLLTKLCRNRWRPCRRNVAIGRLNSRGLILGTSRRFCVR